MTAEIHVGDVGTSMRATIKTETGAIKDVSSASTITMTFKKPNKTTVTKTASLVGDGTDGVVHYVSEEDFFDQAGMWECQGYVIIGGGKFRSDIHEFRVVGNL